MKHYPILFVLFAAVYLLSSCEKTDVSVPGVFAESNSSFDSFVPVNLIMKNIQRFHSFSRGEANDGVTIEPILGEDRDTLMYILNFGRGDGWKIISADSRTPAIIAEGENGYFSLEEGSGGLRFWIEGVKDVMAEIRHSNNNALSFSEQEISANISFWEGDSPKGNVPTPGFDDEGGQWYAHTESEEITTRTQDHMVPKWVQGAPYNRFCPYKRDLSERAPAGCVAVAASQVLCFLHDTLGVASTICSNGYCYGDIDNYNQGFTDPDSTVWSQMSKENRSPNDPSVAEALLIGQVGQVVNMHFDYNFLNGKYFSWALPSNIRTHLFNMYGISCSHGNYNSNAVKSSLYDGMPVIISASDLLIPVDGEIHCFVIDGYKETYIKYSTHHYWHPDNPDAPGNPELTHPSYYTYSYTTPDISAIKINWGWRDQWFTPPVNDGWYSLTGDWLIDTGATWNQNRQMIYGYTIA
jgi:hypothetical protein